MLASFYHGSPIRPDRPALGSKGNLQPQISPGKPFFLTDNLDYALDFARGGHLCAFTVNTSGMASLFDTGLQEALLAIYDRDPQVGPWDEDLWGEVADSTYELLSSPAVTTHLLNKGISLVEVPEDNALGVRSIAVLDANCLRLLSVRRLNE